MQNFIDDIEWLRTALNLDKVYVMGHYWGGLLATKYAIKYPRHVKKLLLLDPMPPGAKLWQQEEIEQAKPFTAADRKAQQQILNSKACKNHSPKAIKQLQMQAYKNGVGC